MITISENAARKVQEFMAAEQDDECSVLRVAIQGGGCSGFQYALGFDSDAQEGDQIIEAHGVRIVVDPFSLPLLKGAGIDYVDGLAGTGFKIDNPNVQAACGCGSSFQAKDESDPTADAVTAGASVGGGCGTCSQG